MSEEAPKPLTESERIELLDSCFADVRVSRGIAHACEMALQTVGCDPGPIANALSYVVEALGNENLHRLSGD